MNSATLSQREKLEENLRLAKAYWLQTIQPHIAGRKLSKVEWYLANQAHRNLQVAIEQARHWNDSKEGKSDRVSAEELVDLKVDDFREPEVLCCDKSPELLAQIAAPLMKGATELRPIDAVGLAHRLLATAERYVSDLPKSATAIDELELAFSKVTFKQIRRSNDEHSAELPMLPPVQKGRGRERKPGTPRLSLAAIKKGVSRFLEERGVNLTKQEYAREVEQDRQFASIGPDAGKSVSYDDWRRTQQEAMNDCLNRDRILLHDLHTLRLKRFKDHWEQQQRRVIKRESRLKKTRAKNKRKL